MFKMLPPPKKKKKISRCIFFVFRPIPDFCFRAPHQLTLLRRFKAVESLTKLIRPDLCFDQRRNTYSQNFENGKTLK